VKEEILHGRIILSLSMKHSWRNLFQQRNKNHKKTRTSKELKVKMD